MPEDYFGERVAEHFDERYAHLADPAVVDPTRIESALRAESGERPTILLQTGCAEG